MKKLWSVFVHTLAINFLLLVGAAGWLWTSAHVDRTKVEAVRDVLFPKEEASSATTQPTTQPGKAGVRAAADAAGRVARPPRR